MDSITEGEDDDDADDSAGGGNANDMVQERNNQTKTSERSRATGGGIEAVRAIRAAEGQTKSESLSSLLPLSPLPTVPPESDVPARHRLTSGVRKEHIRVDPDITKFILEFGSGSPAVIEDLVANLFDTKSHPLSVPTFALVFHPTNSFPTLSFGSWTRDVRTCPPASCPCDDSYVRFVIALPVIKIKPPIIAIMVESNCFLNLMPLSYPLRNSALVNFANSVPERHQVLFIRPSSLPRYVRECCERVPGTSSSSECFQRALQCENGPGLGPHLAQGRDTHRVGLPCTGQRERGVGSDSSALVDAAP